jgi:hypothetical protein
MVLDIKYGHVCGSTVVRATPHTQAQVLGCRQQSNNLIRLRCYYDTTCTVHYHIISISSFNTGKQ